jgi:hypothetical protein
MNIMEVLDMVLLDRNYEQIILRDGKYYLRIDVGHFGPEFIEIEISKEDAEKVMQDEKYSLRIVWNYQNKLWGLV